MCIETDNYDPSLPLAYKIARLFDVTIEEVCDLALKSEKSGQKKLVPPTRIEVVAAT